MNIENLVFSGGGVLGSAYIGALQVLDSKNILFNVKRFAGTSVGAIIAGALVCGASIDFISKIFNETNFNDLKDYSRSRPGSFIRFLRKFGYHKGKKLVSWYEKIIHSLTGNKKITLFDIFKIYNKEIFIVATNVDKRQAEVLSHISYPNLELVQAVRMSASYPFFFESVKYNNDIWIDGGLLNNFPIRIFDGQSSDHMKTLGLVLISSSNLEEIKCKKDHPTSDLIRFNLAIIEMALNSLFKTHFDPVDRDRTIMIDVGNLSSMEFNISNIDKAFLIEQGRIASQSFLDTKLY